MIKIFIMANVLFISLLLSGCGGDSGGSGGIETPGSCTYRAGTASFSSSHCDDNITKEYDCGLICEYSWNRFGCSYSVNTCDNRVW